MDGSETPEREREQALLENLRDLYELGLVLVGDYELKLPLDTYPLDTLRIRGERARCERSLTRARRELVRAHCRRFLRRVLTLGLWRH